MVRRTRVTIIATACVAALGAMLLIPNGKELAVADTAAFAGTTSQETIATIDAMLGNSAGGMPIRVIDRAGPVADAAPDQGSFQTAALNTEIPESTLIDPSLRPDSIGTSAVNLRAGPSSATATVTVLPAGQPLQVGAIQDGWAEVTLDDGTTGWVYSRYLASVAATLPAETATETGASRAVVSNNSNADHEGRTARIEASLAVRAEPSSGSQAMFRTEPGERVRILEVDGNWLRIRTADGSSGWIERAG
jgi:SH3-like domain-containing protein